VRVSASAESPPPIAISSSSSPRARRSPSQTAVVRSPALRSKSTSWMTVSRKAQDEHVEGRNRRAPQAEARGEEGGPGAQGEDQVEQGPRLHVKHGVPHDPPRDHHCYGRETRGARRPRQGQREACAEEAQGVRAAPGHLPREHGVEARVAILHPRRQRVDAHVGDVVDRVPGDARGEDGPERGQDLRHPRSGRGGPQEEPDRVWRPRRPDADQPEPAVQTSIPPAPARRAKPFIHTMPTSIPRWKSKSSAIPATWARGRLSTERRVPLGSHPSRTNPVCIT